MNLDTQHQPHHEDDSLSALLDGELGDQSARLAISQLAGDPARQARFSEYCAIGDLLRGHHDDLPGLTGKIGRASCRERV